MLGVVTGLVAGCRGRFADLLRDSAAREWGSLRFEAALDSLPENATAEQVDTLIEAARAHR